MAEDAVSLKTAKLLMKAGYPQKDLFDKLKMLMESDVAAAKENSKNKGKGLMTVNVPFLDCNIFVECNGGSRAYFTGPTLWDAMKWLRKIEYLHVRASYNLGGDEGWVSIVYDLDKKIPIDQPSLYDIRLDKYGVARAIIRLYPTYEDACDAGIAAACEWLLKTSMSLPTLP